MSESIVDTVRSWLIESKVGLIEYSEVIGRVDRTIAELQDPPSELLSLSLGEDLSWSGRLDLVLHRVSDADCARLAKRLIALVKARELGWEQIEGIAFSAAQVVPDSEFSQGQFAAISEGLYVARECGGPMDQAIDEARNRLMKISEHAV